LYMIDIQKLRRELKTAKKEMRDICDSAMESTESKMSDVQGVRYLELESETRNIDAQIDLAEKRNALDLDNLDEGDEHNDNSDNDEKRGFNSFGDFLMAVRHADTPGGTLDNRLTTRAASGQNETIPTEGGYAVQTDQLAGIMKKVFETSILAPLCRKTNIGPNANGLAWNALDESSRVAGSRNGGARGYWAAEAATVTAAKLKFAKQKLDLEKLMSIVYATDELLEDSVGMESFMTEVVSDELSFLLDKAIFRGSGAGQPLGMLLAPALVTVDKEAAQVADTIVFENIIKIRARMWAQSRKTANWYINQDIEPELQTMAMVVGTGGVPVYLPASGISGAPYDTLFGRPIIPIEHCSTVGSLGDIVFGDLNEYRLIDKGGINKAVSMHVRFLYAEQTFRFTYRVNGTPLWTSALTPAQGSNTLSPFVALAARD
jgi:HK97 family phage major capsid protein